MSNKNSENLLKKRKREEMEKMNRMKSSLDIQRNKNRSIKKGLKRVFLISIESRGCSKVNLLNSIS